MFGECIIKYIIFMRQPEDALSMVSIGNIKLKYGLMLAPMAGVTDRSFRRICKRFGAEYMVSEMISSKAIIYHDTKTPELARMNESEHPMALQIFGSEPDIMAQAVLWLTDNFSPEAIDINMGCPVKKIVGSGDGSALMRNPEKAAAVAGAVVGALDGKVPVTVKIRTGFDSEHKNAVEVAKLLEGVGVSLLCVHGRTREQFYAPPVDIDTIAAVKSAVGIPVIANGGIYSAEDARNMLDRTHCDGIMLGQGVCGNPWLFDEIISSFEGRPFSPPSVDGRIALAKEHTEMLIEDKGEFTGIREARKHLGWYLAGMRGAAVMRHRINLAETKETIFALLDELVCSIHEYEKSAPENRAHII